MPFNKTLILGLGNFLLQDEGVGVHALKEMGKLQWPDHVDLLDGGTGGFVLLSLFQEYSTIIIIDAAISNELPGTVHVIKPKFAKDFPKSLSTHELGLKDLIETAILLNKMPEIHLVTCTIHPQQKMNIQLSREIEYKIPEIIRKVEQIIR